MAKRYWPGRNPVGQEVVLEGDSWVAYRTIVGVVGDTFLQTRWDANSSFGSPSLA